MKRPRSEIGNWQYLSAVALAKAEAIGNLILVAHLYLLDPIGNF